MSALTVLVFLAAWLLHRYGNGNFTNLGEVAYYTSYLMGAVGVLLFLGLLARECTAL